MRDFKHIVEVFTIYFLRTFSVKYLGQYPSYNGSFLSWYKKIGRKKYASKFQIPALSTYILIYLPSISIIVYDFYLFCIIIKVCL